jgi:hypothetical protein
MRLRSKSNDRQSELLLHENSGSSCYTATGNGSGSPDAAKPESKGDETPSFTFAISLRTRCQPPQGKTLVAVQASMSSAKRDTFGGRNRSMSNKDSAIAK